MTLRAYAVALEEECKRECRKRQAAEAEAERLRSLYDYVLAHYEGARMGLQAAEVEVQELRMQTEGMRVKLEWALNTLLPAAVAQGASCLAQNAALQAALQSSQLDGVAAAMALGVAAPPGQLHPSHNDAVLQRLARLQARVTPAVLKATGLACMLAVEETLTNQTVSACSTVDSTIDIDMTNEVYGSNVCAPCNAALMPRLRLLLTEPDGAVTSDGAAPETASVGFVVPEAAEMLQLAHSANTAVLLSASSGALASDDAPIMSITATPRMQVLAPVSSIPDTAAAASRTEAQPMLQACSADLVAPAMAAAAAGAPAQRPRPPKMVPYVRPGSNSCNAIPSNNTSTRNIISRIIGNSHSSSSSSCHRGKCSGSDRMPILVPVKVIRSFARASLPRTETCAMDALHF